MFDLDYIEQHLNKKATENAYLNKKYYFDKQNMTITKIKQNENCNLEYDCAKFFCEYYRNNLNLDFKINIDSISNTIITISPIVENLKNNFNPDNLLKNTNIILNEFTQQNEFFKKILLSQDLYIKTHVQDISIDNFFKYNNEIYLLDLETFYFSIYMPNDINIGLLGIKDEYKDTIKKYELTFENKDNKVYEDCLVY